MKCSRIDDAGAWVLRALEDAEADDFATHQLECTDCRREVSRLRETVHTLPMAAPQIAPDANLKARLMATVTAEAELLAAAGAEADRPVAPAPPKRRSWWSGLSVRPALALAACAVLALAVVGGVALTGDDAPATRTIASDVPGVTLVMEGDHAALKVSKLDRPPAGRVYQVWLQRGDRAPEPTRTLFDVPAAGSTRVDLEEQVDDDVTRVLVTAEPRGGSEVPTSDPVVTADV